jgi:uncharacterized protein (TIGR03086 family)
MEMSERYRKVAAGFSHRVRAVPAGAWDNPAPCEGWLARDVVRHLVEWVPSFFPAGAGVEVPPIPPVEKDPLGAWEVLDGALQAALDNPEVAASEFDSRAGHHSVEGAIGMLILPDILIHTWDLARATGLDETLDPDEVHGLFVGMQPYDEMLRQSGHYGPRVEVALDADEQTRLIAFTGRRP